MASVGALSWRRNGEQFDESVERRASVTTARSRASPRGRTGPTMRHRRAAEMGFEAKREPRRTTTSARSPPPARRHRHDAVDTTVSTAEPSGSRAHSFLAASAAAPLAHPGSGRAPRPELHHERVHHSPRANLSWQPAREPPCARRGADTVSRSSCSDFRHRRCEHLLARTARRAANLGVEQYCPSA